MYKTTLKLLLLIQILAAGICAQTATPPPPSAPRSATVPEVREDRLSDGLKIATIEKKAAPIVTIRYLVRSGAGAEGEKQAGLAELTASMLTKGTQSRTATQIAESVEFLGGTIIAGADWNSSFVSLTVTSDKFEEGLAILADVVQNPKFDDKELELLKSQTLDGLTYNLKQPSFLANYVASRYVFGEHPLGGTPESVSKVTASDLRNFYARNFTLPGSVLIFTGDVSAAKAKTAAEKLFVHGPVRGGLGSGQSNTRNSDADSAPPPVQQILVIDLPKSGQAAVTVAEKLYDVKRNGPAYYAGSVVNSVLGGGYSSRLNLEIRIKRGLSYGAGSNIGWRRDESNFLTRAQTKNESAAQVLELTKAEIRRLSDADTANDELVPRKSVLTGNFGRNLETSAGLAAALAELYVFDIPVSELNAYVKNVNAVAAASLKDFAGKNLVGGRAIIVGDYSLFKDDLATRFPSLKVTVIKASELDLSKPNLHK